MNEDHDPWRTIDTQEIYSNNWISVTHSNVINPSGNKGIYGKVHYKNVAVGIVALDTEMNIYLVGQFRFAINRYSWEIPEGGCPFNEDPQDAAQRELLEETGLKAVKWKQVLIMHLSNSISDEYAILFVATGLSQHNAAPEETEELTIKKIPFNKAYQMVENGTITDSMTVAGIFKIKLLLLEKKLVL